MITLPDGRQGFMSPDDDTVDAYLSFIKTAQKRIWIADYSFNLDQLVELLIEKFNQGIDVRLVLDKSQSRGVTEKPEVLKILQAKIPTAIGTSSHHKIMHMKYTVLDDVSQYGSWNYTSAASDEDNMFFIDPSSVVSQWLANIFTEMFTFIKQHESN